MSISHGALLFLLMNEYLLVERTYCRFDTFTSFPGEIIMFDEYDGLRWPGAKKAIDDYSADKPEKPMPYYKSIRKYCIEKQ